MTVKTILTRFRDIPYDEAKKCASQVYLDLTGEDSREKWEQHYRGRSVQIIIPAVEITDKIYLNCNGPFYSVIGRGIDFVVCPHTAEIGD